jgi:hypothetical protein
MKFLNAVIQFTIYTQALHCTFHLQQEDKLVDEIMKLGNIRLKLVEERHKHRYNQ